MQRDVAPAATGGVALLIGAVLDGISENTAIGISLAADPSLGLVLLVAVFLGNVPESLGSAVGMRHAGRSRRHIVTRLGRARRPPAPWPRSWGTRCWGDSRRT